MDDSRLLQESNLAAGQPQGATSVIQAILDEGFAQGPYVATRDGVEPTTFRTKGTDNLHLTNHTPIGHYSSRQCHILSQRSKIAPASSSPPEPITSAFYNV